MRRGGGTQRQQNPKSQAQQTSEGENVRIDDKAEASAHQSRDGSEQKNATQNDNLAERLATAIASLLPNLHEDNSIERAIKLGAKPFFGTDDPADAKAWIRNMESIFKVMACADDKKVLFATFLLRDFAADWWIYFRDRYTDHPSTITWTIFKDGFLDTFYPQSFQDANKFGFFRGAQGSMSVAQYERKFVNLWKDAGDFVTEEREKCRWFEYGLRADIGALVTAAGHDNFETLVQAALRVEKAIIRGRTRGEPINFFSGSSQSTAVNGELERKRHIFWPGVTHTTNFKSRSQSFGPSQSSRRSHDSMQQPMGGRSHYKSSFQGAHSG